MTVRELLETFDACKSNQHSDSVKTAWVNDVEGRVQCEIMGKTPEKFVKLMSEDDTLTVPDAYSRIYLLYLASMCELASANYDAYESASKAYENAILVYAKSCIRNRCESNGRKGI